MLLKALAKERDDRYPDANTLAGAFIQAIQSETEIAPVVITPDTDLIDELMSEKEPEPQIVAPTTTVAEVETAVPAVMLDVEGAPAKEADEVQIVEDASAPIKKKRRFRWWYILVGIIFLMGCCFCGFVGYNLITGDGSTDLPAAEQLPEEPLPEPFVQPDQPMGLMEAPPLDEARSWVDDAADDPYAWLNLAEAYWAVGEADEAKQALNQALTLSQDDPDFYFEIASYLADNLFWVEAAHIYLEGIKQFHPDKIPLELLDDFREAVYWAAESPQAERDIPLPEIATVDPPMERIAKARHLFHSGDEDEAFFIVEQLLADRKPGMPEALYLKSEILYSWGDTQSAFNILYVLQERDDTPDWIREIIDQLLEDAFSMQRHAQEQIDADPENPYVYLPLYEWYLSFGLYDEAADLLQQAIRVAGEDLDFILTASDVAGRTGAWLEAAQLLRYAGQVNPDLINPEFSERILQALYFGAIDPGALEVLGEIETYLPEGERGVIRGAYRDALIARYKLYNEDPGEAQALIEEVVNRAVIMPLPRLVQAETYLFTGEISQGEAILLELQNSRTTPPWVKDEVQFMLDEIKINP